MYKFKFADVGEGIHEAVVCEWYVKEGDEVVEGQEIYSVETDKFTTDVTTPVDGKIKKIYYPEGSNVTVGDLMVDIDDGSGDEEEVQVEEQASAEASQDGASVVGDIKVSDEIIETYHDKEVSKENKQEKALATPVARNFAKLLNVDINLVTPTGPKGRVTKEDIQKYVDSQKEEQVPVIETVSNNSGNYEKIKMTKIRETISKNMVRSKHTIPHTSAMYEINVDELWSLRKEINQSLADEQIKLSFLPFIVKAIATSLKKHPIMNSELDDDNKEIIIKKFYNIGIAVDTEAGLVVPVVKDADKLSILEIHEQIKTLSTKAASRELGMESMSGGTFTITNYGSIAGIFGTPVINYPETAIIGIGSIYKKAVFDAEDNVVPQYTLPISISFDHRIIDGGEVSRFILTLSKILSSKIQLVIN